MAAARLRRYFEQQMKQDSTLLPVDGWPDHISRPSKRIFVTKFAKEYYRVPKSVLGFPVVVFNPRRGELPTDKPQDLVFEDEPRRK